MFANIIALFETLESYKKIQLFILLLLMVIASAAEALSISAVLPFLSALTSPEKLFNTPFLSQTIDFLGAGSPEDILLLFTILFCVAVILSGLLRLSLLYFQTRISHSIGSDISSEIYLRTILQPYEVHTRKNTSDMISVISMKTDGVIYQVILPVLTLCNSIILSICIFSVILVLDPIVACTAFFGFSILYGVIILSTKKQLSYAGAEVNREQNNVIKILQESLGGIRHILLENNQLKFASLYDGAITRMRKSRANIEIISGSPRYVIEPLGIVLISILALYLSSKSDGVVGAIPTLGMMGLAAQRLLPIAQQAYSAISSIRGGHHILIETLVFLQQPIQPNLNLELHPEVEFEKSIRLEEVGFSYSDNKISILENINLTIEKGSRVGIIGETGSGKSTLIDLIIGILKPTTGELLVDDVIINSNNDIGWKRKIAYVPQAIFLSDSTISENIALGVYRGDIDNEKVRHSANVAQIDKKIESWPLKYDTIVGERGARISGGQKQRIGIARAIYKNADVIVLDEATSALDDNTERSLMQALDLIKSDKTVIIVAHRLTTLKGCSKIFNLKNGRLFHLGSYDEMMSHKSKTDS